MEIVKVGVIGTGNWGKNHVRNFANLSKCKLTFCCDADTNKLNWIKSAYPSVEVSTEYKDAFKNGMVDALVIATSAPTHYPIAKEALNNNKHVFIEKPMVLRSSEAKELTELAESKKLTLMVGHLLEYSPAIDKIKDLINSGEIGDIYYIYSQRVNLGVIRSEENALWSFAPHDISIVLYLLGEEPCDVSARGQSFLQKNVEDVVFLNMKFKTNKMANIQLSWLDPHKIRKTTIVGSKKMIVFDDVESVEKVKIFDKGVEPSIVSYYESLQLRSGDIWIPKIDLKEPLNIESNHFINAIITGTRPRSDGYDGIRVTKVLEAAQKSLERNGEIINI